MASRHAPAPGGKPSPVPVHSPLRTAQNPAAVHVPPWVMPLTLCGSPELTHPHRSRLTRTGRCLQIRVRMLHPVFVLWKQCQHASPPTHRQTRLLEPAYTVIPWRYSDHPATGTAGTRSALLWRPFFWHPSPQETADRSTLCAAFHYRLRQAVTSAGCECSPGPVPTCFS